jgi:hypothetical protein
VVHLNLVGEAIAELFMGMTYVFVKRFLHEMGRGRAGEELNRIFVNSLETCEIRNVPSCHMIGPSHP